ncbi:phosphoesterase [Olivibacter sitiensis]|uniref:phosphoesterase n=1 Tax=Olivibacter sitiensis TaxID=376470 RepID=UPI00146FAB02|nr:phosphoesterase [Olivibacter sitiensis]
MTLFCLIAIKGNHDDWFHEFISTDFHPQYWSLGESCTLKSYLGHADKPGMFRATRSGYKTALVSSDIPVTHRNFFTHQRSYHIDGQGRCFVHGGFILGRPLDRQRPQEFYWNRNLWENAYQHKLMAGDEKPDPFAPVPDFSEVYLGHTPTINWGTDQPLNAYNIWNLDTGAGHSGRLTIMDVDTKHYWQSDPLPKLYDKNFRQEPG